LFTSEGCSSCPPADELLIRMQKDHGQRIIPLSFHVDYWDYIGWKDPFASREFTQRQERYNRALGEGSNYTPQMIVDGREAFVGSDASKAKAAIQRATPSSKVSIHVHRDQAGLKLSIPNLGLLKASAELMLFITEDDLQSRVQRGENGGRLLHHTAVVREARRLRSVEPGAGPIELVIPLKTSELWKQDALRAVILLQSSTGQIWGAASFKL
jgi:hypothetical protein